MEIDKILFVGVPNSGKSALINKLTSSKSCSVGNWNGTTVKTNTVKIKHSNKELKFIDTPGMYNFFSSGTEEGITRNCIEKLDFNLIANVVDGTNLLQQLNLTLCLREINIPMVVIVTRMDLFKKLKLEINKNRLENILLCPVLFTSAKRNDCGATTKEILDTISEEVKNQSIKQYFHFYNQILVNVKNEVIYKLRNQNFQQLFCDSEDKLLRFYAIRVVENNTHYVNKLEVEGIKMTEIRHLISNASLGLRMPICNLLSEARKIFSENVIKRCVKSEKQIARIKTSLKIDKFLLHKYFGLPIALLILFFGFILVYDLAIPFKNFLNFFLTGYIPHFISEIPMPDWLNSLLIDGVFGGVGTIITFVPLMFFLFLFIGLIRESGYFNRLCFILDRILMKFGINGKAMIPLILGFGCNVTSIYATRTMQNEKKRKATALIVPFITCSARLTIITLFAAAFFPQIGGIMMFVFYMFSVIVALGICKVITLIMRVETDNHENIYEVPPYQLPHIKSLFLGLGQNMKGYVKKASTFILVISLFLWLVTYFPSPNNPNDSYIAIFSRFIGPIFYPLGFGHIWQYVATIFPAINAKEVTISTLGIFSGISGGDNIQGIDIINQLKLIFISIYQSFSIKNFFGGITSTSDSFSQSYQAIGDWLKNLPGNTWEISMSFLLFMLLTIPCVTTLVSIKIEFGYKMLGISIFLGLVVPYIICLLFFSITKLGAFF